MNIPHTLCSPAEKYSLVYPARNGRERCTSFVHPQSDFDPFKIKGANVHFRWSKRQVCFQHIPAVLPEDLRYHLRFRLRVKKPCSCAPAKCVEGFPIAELLANPRFPYMFGNYVGKASILADSVVWCPQKDRNTFISPEAGLPLRM